MNPPVAPPRPARLRRLSLLLAVNLLIFASLAELIALSYLYVTTGRLFYTAALPHTETSIPLAANGPADEAAVVALRNRLTPLSGHITMEPNRQAGHFYVNNYGFRSKFGDYPTPPTTDEQVVIGIFGGSVAAQIYTLGFDTVVETIQADPRYQDKEIILLSFCLPGYKQPAQLTLLNYFLSIGQPLDIIVNLDGFNEVALSAVNQRLGVVPTLFSAGHTIQARGLINQANLSPAKISALYEISSLQQRATQLQQMQRETRSAAVYFVAAQLIRRANNQYQQALLDFESIPVAPDNSIIYMPPANPDLTPTEVLQMAADQWAEASLLMYELAQSRDIQYVHMLQANQYFTERTFSPEEAAVALNPDQPYRPSVIDGYPLLLTASERLEAAGVAFFDSSAVFADISEPVYNDDCCHYTDSGVQAMAAYIGAAILAGD